MRIVILVLAALALLMVAQAAPERPIRRAFQWNWKRFDSEESL